MSVINLLFTFYVHGLLIDFKLSYVYLTLFFVTLLSVFTHLFIDVFRGIINSISARIYTLVNHIYFWEKTFYEEKNKWPYRWLIVTLYT